MNSNNYNTKATVFLQFIKHQWNSSRRTYPDIGTKVNDDTFYIGLLDRSLMRAHCSPCGGEVLLITIAATGNCSTLVIPPSDTYQGIIVCVVNLNAIIRPWPINLKWFVPVKFTSIGIRGNYGLYWAYKRARNSLRDGKVMTPQENVA